MSNPKTAGPGEMGKPKRPLPFLAAVTAGIVLAFLLLRWLGPVGQDDDDHDEVHVQNSQVLHSPTGDVLKLSQQAFQNAGITIKPVTAHSGETTIDIDEIIYLNGRAWVYRDVGVDAFQRIPVTILNAVNSTQVQVTGVQSGESIVNTGAGLLLSEELKSQMVEED